MKRAYVLFGAPAAATALQRSERLAVDSFGVGMLGFEMGVEGRVRQIRFLTERAFVSAALLVVLRAAFVLLLFLVIGDDRRLAHVLGHLRIVHGV